MRLIAFFMLVTAMHVTAKSISQTTVTFSGKNVPVKEVFTAIKKQTGYVVFYDRELLKQARSVTVTLVKIPLEEFLKIVLKDQPLDYTIKDRTIFISKKMERKNTGTRSDAPPVTGVVRGPDGQPLAGVNVMVKGTKKGTVTDKDGRFTIDAEDGSVLEISSIGFGKKVITISSSRELVIALETASSVLDEVQYIAYGQTSKRFQTGNVTTIKGEEIQKQPVNNVLLALQGRVPGMFITQNNGIPGGGITTRIQGQNSIQSGNDPLYVIDGIPYYSQLPSSGLDNVLGNSGQVASGNLRFGGNPLSYINPADIESIEVLKDADATSIYGSRGANGVILISTKSGKPGKTHFEVQVESGINMVTRYWDMLNTQQYLAMRREAFKNDNITPDPSNAADLLVWDTTRYTNWQKSVFGKTANITNVQTSLSGGNMQTNFRMSASFTTSTTITSASGADQRASLSLNINHHSIDQRFSIAFFNTFSYTESDLIQLPGRIDYAPNAPSIFDSKGQLNWSEWNALYGTTGSNPFATLLQPYNAKTNFLNSNLLINFQPVRGLKLSTSFGYNTAQSYQISLIPIVSQDPATNPTGTAFFGNNRNNNWIIEPQLNYNSILGPGNFSVLIGGSLQQTITDGVYSRGERYNNDALLRSISNAPVKYSSDNYGEYRYAAIFGRIGYDIGHKYLLNINARRDGSSNYGPGNEFGNFASIGAAWIVSEEPWLKNIRLLSFAKIQASYGTTGSDGGKPYGYITRWTGNGLLTYNEVQPVIPTQHANPDYHWQLNRKLETSVSLGFFKDLFTIRTAYYRSRTNNQLLDYPTPMFSGFGTVLANLPALVQNEGWEFTIGGRGIQTQFFKWSPNINLSINQNKFISFPGLGSTPYRNSGLIGKPLNGLFLLHYTGVDSKTGEYTYEDKDGDGEIKNRYVEPNGGDLYFKKISPSISTGFGFNFELKNIELAIHFTAKRQTGVNGLAQGNYPGILGYNQPVEVLGRWVEQDDISKTARFSTYGAQDPFGYIFSSDIGYTDASYIRLTNASLSYLFPGKFIKKIGLGTCKLYINATNILTITGYKGIDPETQNFGGMPPTRTIVGGISMKF